MAFFAGIVDGLSTFNNGRLLMKKHPQLWHLALIPIVVTILLSILALGMFLALVAYYLHSLHARYGAYWWGGIVEFIFGAMMILTACGLTVAVYFVLNAVLAGFYFTKLARQAEIILGMPPAALREIHWGWQILDAMVDLAILIGVMIFCLALNCVPVVGTILSTLLSFYVNFYIFGAQFMDFPLLLRGMLRFPRRNLAHKHLGNTLGMGAVVFFFQFIPVLGGVVLAWTVLGAVLMLRRLEPQLGPEGAARLITATTVMPVDVKRIDRQ